MYKPHLELDSNIGWRRSNTCFSKMMVIWHNDYKVNCGIPMDVHILEGAQCMDWRVTSISLHKLWTYHTYSHSSIMARKLVIAHMSQWEVKMYIEDKKYVWNCTFCMLLGGKKWKENRVSQNTWEWHGSVLWMEKSLCLSII